MGTSPTPLVGFNQPWIPLTNITPFTFTGHTFLEMYLELRDYLQGQFNDDVNAKLKLIYDQTQAMVNGLAADITATKIEWQALFDEFMLNIIDELEGLNDQAVANLVNSATSQLRLALNANFIQVTDGLTFYVNPVSGNNANAGSEASPFKNVQFALDKCLEKTVKGGNAHHIYLAAGTYAELLRVPDETPFNYKIELHGPDVGGHPNPPIAVFTQGNNASAQAFINRNKNATFIFHDIAFNGYNGTASSGGLTNVDGHLETHNCHFNNCFYGASSFTGDLIIPDGVFRNCGRLGDGSGSGGAIRSIALNRHSIGRQNNGHRNNTVLIEDCYRGALVQEGCSGHFDYVTIRECDRGIATIGSARVNATGTLFDFCNIGIYAQSASNLYLPDSTVFNRRPGQVSFRILSGSSLVGSRVLDGVSEALATNDGVMEADYTRVDVGTAVTKVYERDILPGNFDEPRGLSRTAVKMINTRTVFRIPTSANASERSVSIRSMGANIKLLIPAATVGMVEVDVSYRFIDNLNQIMEARVTGLGLNNRYISEWTYDMTGRQTLLMQADKANAADVMYAVYTETIVRL